MSLSDCGGARLRVRLSPTVTTSIQALLEQIVSECSVLGQALSSLAAKLEKLEKHLEETDHRVEALEAKVMSTQGCVVKHSTLMRQLAAGCGVADHRLETLENKVRARNVRVTGVPAAVRDANLIPFLENLVPSSLDLNGKEVPICIESAHRLPASSAQESSGSTVLITLSDLRHRERILKASRASRTTEFHGRKVSFFPDLSPATYARRKHFIALKQQFLKLAAQAYVLYPAKLKVVHQGKTYIFKDHIPATQLLDRIRQERITMTLIRNRLGLLVLGVLVTFVLYLLLPAIQHERFTSSVDVPKPRGMEGEMKKGQGAGNVTILTGKVLQNPSVFFREAVLVPRDKVPTTESGLEVIFLHGQSFTSKTWEELGTLALLSENGYRVIAIDLPGMVRKVEGPSTLVLLTDTHCSPNLVTNCFASSKVRALPELLLINHIGKKAVEMHKKGRVLGIWGPDGMTLGLPILSFLQSAVFSERYGQQRNGYGDSPRSSTVETAQSRVAFLQQVLKELGLHRPVLISSSMSGRYSIPFLLANGDQLKGFVPIAPVGTKDFPAQQFREVKTPTLIIYGEFDTGLGTQSLQILQQIPKARIVMLPTAGHACYLDRPEEFHKALLNFLDELKGL